MSIKHVAAHTLRLGQIVIPDNGAPRRITTCRIEGAHPHVIIGYADTTEHTSYPAAEILTIQDVE